MHGDELLSELRARRLLAIVRDPDPGRALATVRTLAEAGVRLIEVSLTGADALAVVEKAGEIGNLRLGVGTVCSVADVRDAVAAGAEFVVTPGFSDALDECRRLGVPVLAGALTPSEVIAARDAGATAVKLFPAGGPAQLRALRDPFPDVPFVPVGGVDVAAAREYLAAGALAVGVGGPLTRAAGLAAKAAEFRAVAEAA
ncbi:bifunctional 4-hydroxy-2-oxoglutarate aldolase/2-dehydro-3-deoxy-phosphogluconate aldolase [Amycolatopsis sp. La24]|uniref:bifunctional 4-hydroxy-2-oxoglutarate aldolase/2-dehydro-3-deoxy-phosphogluconate aldolase n=1 Tax=Amycolatopsis sp. La24 TaxID=3028304 RepID=UPI0023B00DDE|nr:bifunctional 4-hydroxy-2-oxoglutarate aldolase/2-dehydro-3-deoxy-phosphogluconate aldolase [Amycolatopsis sp. La24]